MLFFTCLKAQELSDKRITYRNRGSMLEKFLDAIKSEHNIRFYYKPEWIDTFLVTRDFVETPLIQVLNSLFQNKNLTWRFFQDGAVIIYPRQGTGIKRFIDDLQLLVIGDPLNEGRYKSATLEGKIVDGKNGDPLPGAVISGNRTGKATTTDQNGNFRIEMPVGEYTLEISFLGFQPSMQKIRLIESGYAEFVLIEETHMLGEVTVTGEYNDLPHSQMSLIRMDTRKMKNIPALMGEVDLIRSMTLQAGVQSVGELASGFNVRGGNTDQNLLMINGSPLFNASHLLGFLSVINPDIVENISLFKGGIPVRMGERISSVIEVDLKDGNDKAFRLYGGLGIINSRLAVDGPLSKNKKLTITAGGRSTYTSWILKEIPNPEISQSVTNFFDAATKLSLKFNKYNRMSAMMYISNDKFSTSAQTITHYNSILGNLQSRNQFTGSLSGEGNAAFSSYTCQLTDLANGKKTESYHLDNRMQYSALRYNLRFRHLLNTIDAGFNLIYYLNDPGRITPDNDQTTIVTQKLQQEKALEWAGYLSDEIEISNSFSFSAGVRMSGFSSIGTPVVYLYDKSRPKSPESVIDSLTFKRGDFVKTFTNFEPRLLFRLETSPGYVLKLNIQRTSQYIFQISNNAVISPVETWKTSDYHLMPIICDQVALGFENNKSVKNIELSAEVYYRKLSNLPEYKNGALLIMNPHIETSLIPSDGYAYGVELQGKKNSGRLTGWVSYVYSRAMRKINSIFEEEKLWAGRYYPSIYDRPHDLSVVGTYNISRRWRFSGNFTFVSGRPVTLPERQYTFSGETLIYYSERNKYRMPPYHRLDLSVTLDENLRKKRMWKGSWTFSVYNCYGRNNPYSVYYRKTVPSEDNNFRVYSLFKLSVIGIPVPSLTYNFTF